MTFFLIHTHSHTNTHFLKRGRHMLTSWQFRLRLRQHKSPSRSPHEYHSLKLAWSAYNTHMIWNMDRSRKHRYSPKRRNHSHHETGDVRRSNISWSWGITLPVKCVFYESPVNLSSITKFKKNVLNKKQKHFSTSVHLTKVKKKVDCVAILDNQKI